jgi:hypothetical protein
MDVIAGENSTGIPDTRHSAPFLRSLAIAWRNHFLGESMSALPRLNINLLADALMRETLPWPDCWVDLGGFIFKV